MLRCFTARYIPQFQFFKEFLDDTVSQVRYLRVCDGLQFHSHVHTAILLAISWFAWFSEWFH